MTIASETRTVREAVAVFDRPVHLQAAIDELLSSGFHRAELSLLDAATAIPRKHSGGDAHIHEFPIPAP